MSNSVTDTKQYKDKINGQFYWWLSKSKSFILNDEYEIKLLFIDQNHMSAKIQITNLKTKETKTIEESME